MAKHASGKASNDSGTATPVGVNHVVLNVYDIEESHQFWTDVIGLAHVGTLRPRPEMGELPPMRFYSGDHDGKLTHHDLALVENPNLPPRPEDWSVFGGAQAINHVAFAMPDRESWLEKLADLQAKGVKFNLRVDHGMTHSVYINDPNGYGVEVLYELPNDVWEHDIDGALNYAVVLPEEELLTDTTDYETNFS